MLENTEAKSHQVVIYARLARPSREGLDTQVSTLKTVAAEHGWATPTVIAESRPSAMSEEALRAVLSCDVVLVRDITRLARDVGRLIEIRRSLIDCGVVVAMPDRVESPDMAQQHVDVMMLLRPTLAAGPRRDYHAERTQPGIAAARAAGRRRIVLPRPSAPPEEPFGVDGQVSWLIEELRRLDRAAHSERTRRGIAAAKARREVQR